MPHGQNRDRGCSQNRCRSGRARFPYPALTLGIGVCIEEL